MRRKVVVAVPHSQSNCWTCARANETLPFCAHCGAIQAAPEPLDYFAFLEEPLGLSSDETRLRNTFYERSKQVHPDRFSAKSPKEQTLAARWSAELNKGYRLLKDRSARASYLLARFGVATTDAKKVPLELAEEYFSLQDLLAEGKTEALEQFYGRLAEMKTDLENDWKKASEEWTNARQEVLKTLPGLLTREKYLDAMMNDVRTKLDRT